MRSVPKIEWVQLTQRHWVLDCGPVIVRAIQIYTGAWRIDSSHGHTKMTWKDVESAKRHAEQFAAGLLEMTLSHLSELASGQRHEAQGKRTPRWKAGSEGHSAGVGILSLETKLDDSWYEIAEVPITQEQAEKLGADLGMDPAIFSGQRRRVKQLRPDAEEEAKARAVADARKFLRATILQLEEMGVVGTVHVEAPETVDEHDPTVFQEHGGGSHTEVAARTEARDAAADGEPASVKK